MSTVIDLFLEQYLSLCDEYRLTEQEMTVLWARLKMQTAEALLWREHHPGATPEQAHAAIRAMTLAELVRVVRGTTHGTPIERKRNVGVLITGGCDFVLSSSTQRLLTTSYHLDTRIEFFPFTQPTWRDFELRQTVAVMDGCAFIGSLLRGIDLEMETMWELADEYRLPKVVFVEDPRQRVRELLDRFLEQLRSRFKTRPVLLSVPGNHDVTIDLVQMTESGIDPPWIRPELRPYAERHQRALCDLLGDPATAADPSAGRLKNAIREATLGRAIVPVLFGEWGAGKSSMMQFFDALVDYLPSPIDRPPLRGWDPVQHRTVYCFADDREPLAARVYKVTSDPYLGKLAHARIDSGFLKVSQLIWNSTRSEIRGIGKLLQMDGEKREEIKETRAGDIVVISGLADVRPGDCLCDRHHPFVIPPIPVPEPLVRGRIRANHDSGRKALESWLPKLMDEDPTFQVIPVPNDRSFAITGMGERHFELIVGRLDDQVAGGVRLERVEVIYRETITRAATAEGKFNGLYVKIELEPRRKPDVFIKPEAAEPQALLDGVREALDRGAVAGHSMIGVRVLVISLGAGHPTDESSFKKAGFLACSKAMRAAAPVVVEPVMEVEILPSSGRTEEIVEELRRRRGEIQRRESREDTEAIRALVPLRELLGYRAWLENRAECTMRYHAHRPVPPDSGR